jgi:hypothetical protein
VEDLFRDLKAWRGISLAVILFSEPGRQPIPWLGTRKGFSSGVTMLFISL